MINHYNINESQPFSSNIKNIERSSEVLILRKEKKKLNNNDIKDESPVKK